MPYYKALPTTLSPLHYDVSIYNIDFNSNTFSGTVKILLRINSTTDELHLNIRDLIVTSEGFSAQTPNGTIGAISAEVHKEVVIFKFDREVSPEEKTLEATINYDAILQTNMAGFYKSTYTENGQEKCMASTQFEATDARRAFPCLDEPALKATFQVSLTLDKHLTALGNTPVEKETTSDALKTVTFEKTPVMSTYLVAWAVGEFEYVESFTEDLYGGKKMPVRVYTTPGYVDQAQFAVEIAPRVVDYFSRVFEVQYPLPKLDLLAVHAFSHNAMENWGLITYRSTAVLFSEEKSDPAYKQKVAYVVAHELAHQWFGNLVTMQWWDELWLNEGFATWVGFYAVDYLFPEWDVFSGFVSDSVQGALNLDGLRNSHPVSVPVEDALDIDQLFDAISYLKGASAILMLSTHLGTEPFLKGVALYLQRNQYSNATSADLWDAVAEVCGVPVKDLMHNWITKVGFPVVDVERHDTKLKLTQRRFLSSGDVKDNEDSTIWWVPLNQDGSDDSLFEKSITIPSPTSYFKLNKDSSAPFRVNYSPEILSVHVLPYITQMSNKDRVGLVADVAALAAAGACPTTELLKLATSIANAPELDNDYVTWLELGKRIDHLRVAFSGTGSTDLISKLRSFARAIYEPKACKIIDNVDAKVDFVQGKLRANILDHAATLGIERVDAYALDLFDKWCAGTPLPPSLKAFVFKCVAAQDSFTNTQYEAIFREVSAPSSVDSREIALGALGAASNSQIIDRLLNALARPDVVPTMDAHYLAVALSANANKTFVDFLFTNYDALYSHMSTNMVVFERFLKTTLCNCSTREVYDRIRQFFSSKDLSGFQMGYEQAMDKVKINVAWHERERTSVEKYLETDQK